MNKNRVLTAFVFALMFLVFNPNQLNAQDNSSGCIVDSSYQAVFGPRDTLRAVAIWASSTNNVRGTKLPPFWRQVWDVNQRISVPRFYRDNSDSAGVPRFVLNADVFGAPDSSCFVGGNFSQSCGGNDPIVFKIILDSADAYIDFRNYDRNGDRFVDAVFFCISDSNDLGLKDICISGTYFTKDFVGLEPIKINRTTGVHAYVLNREEFVQTMCHEIGHYITPAGALGEYRIVGSFGWWVTGSFTVMGKSGFQRRASPFHPFQNHKFMGWDQPVDITTSIYNQQVEPYFSSVKKFYRVKKSNTEYFEVSYHRAGLSNSPWEEMWPANGFLIAHINDTVVNPVNFNRKQIDLELPHGLRDVTGNPPVFLSTLNDSTGRDSLDDAFSYPIANGDTVALSDPIAGSNIGSATCLWPVTISGALKNAFDDKTNPSSRVYSTPGVQNVLSRLAVENMALNGSTASADFIVNAQFGEISSNTTWGPGVVGVIGDVRVKNGATLTVAAGTTVKFQRNYDNQKLGSDTTKCGVTVESGGKLVVNGTSGSPVLFVSSSPSPGSNDWEGILVKSGGSAKLAYTHIRNAYTGISYQNVSASDTLRNVHIARCEIIGVRADTTPNLVMRNCGIDSIRTTGAGVGFYVVSGSSGGPLIRSCSTRACYTGMDIWRWASVESCQVLGPHISGDFISRTGIKATGQGNYSPITELNVAATNITGYFADQHYQNAALFGRSSMSLCSLVSLETTRSPYGVRNTAGEYLYMRYSTVMHWGTAGILVEHNGGATVTDLGTVSSPTDSGYNRIYSSVSGSTWKYVLDNDCGSCSTPVLKAEWNCWGTQNPSSSRFSSNVDYTPFGSCSQIEGDPKLATEKGNLPDVTALFQNYPNPFNPSTQIQFTLAQTEPVRLEIYNILGQKVKTMLGGEEFSAGPYIFIWNGRDDNGSSVASGVYFYKLTTPSYSQTKKMSLVK